MINPKFKKIHIFDTIEDAWENMRSHFWFYIGMAILFFALNIGSNLTFSFFLRQTLGEDFGGFLSGIVNLLVSTLLTIGVVNISLNATTKEGAKFEHFYSKFSSYLKVLGAQVLMILLSLVIAIPAIIIFLILIFVFGFSFVASTSSMDSSDVMAGIIAMIFGFIGIVAAVSVVLVLAIHLLIRYAFAVYFIIDKNMGVIEGFQASSQITKGYKLRLLVLYFLTGAITLLGMLFFYVGIIVTIPISWLIMAYTYRRLCQINPVQDAYLQYKMNSKPSPPKMDENGNDDIPTPPTPTENE